MVIASQYFSKYIYYFTKMIKEELNQIPVKSVSGNFNSFLSWVSAIWNVTPNQIKIVLYVLLAGLLTRLQLDIANAHVVNQYLQLLIVALNDVILYTVQWLSGKTARNKGLIE
jgi:hypothetical protein